MIMVTTLLRLQTLIAPLSSCAKTVTLSSTGSVKQLPRGVKKEHGPMSKQAPGESYQGATTFNTIPNSFKRIDLFSLYVLFSQ